MTPHNEALLCWEKQLPALRKLRKRLVARGWGKGFPLTRKGVSEVQGCWGWGRGPSSEAGRGRSVPQRGACWVAASSRALLSGEVWPHEWMKTGLSRQPLVALGTQGGPC